ncbi:hypothetical protein N0V90_003089 [Kalmusia sp. IMI 367209]|nr:hypothetical protein N0V90_003089 [Kalmusia sp. IMI 367209]
MTNVYILSLSYTNSTTSNFNPSETALSKTLDTIKGLAQLEVRTGYFGMCVRSHGILWLCSADTNGLTEQIGPGNDPLNLIGAASKFKDDVLFSGLLFMAIVLSLISFCLLGTFPGWSEEATGGSDVDVKPFPSRPVSQVALSCAAVAAILSLIAGLWQHVGSVGAAAMAEMANYGNVKADIGTGAVAMGWAGVFITTMPAIGLFVMIMSIIVLDRLTDD